MNKSELATKMAEKAGLKKTEAEKALKAFIDTVTEELVNGGDVRLVGFGTFDVKTREARTGVNPRTGEKMDIASSKAPRFKVGKAFKDAVNK